MKTIVISNWGMPVLAGVLVLATTGGVRADGVKAAKLFQAAPEKALALAQRQRPEVVESRPVLVRRDLVANARIGDRLELNLFDGHDYVTKVDRVHSRTANSVTLRGVLDGVPGGFFILATQGDAVVALIQDATATIEVELESDADGTSWLRRIDAEQRPKCRNSPPAPADLANAPKPEVAPGEAPLVAQPSPTLVHACPPQEYVFDYLVMYTDLARQAAGSRNAIEAKILTYVEHSNLVYENSGITARMRMVYCGEISYDEDPGNPPPGESVFLPHLDRFSRGGDGIMDEVHSLRAANRADACMLLLADNRSGGLAWCCADANGTFAVMKWNNGANTFTHEFGHNQGAAHNAENVDCECQAWARGWHYDGDDGIHYGTVMSYIGQKIPYFSNPYVTFAGRPTGVEAGLPDQAYNALMLNLTSEPIERIFPTRFDIWVDFRWPQGGDGTWRAPFSTVTAGAFSLLEGVRPSELPNLWVQTGMSPEVLTIDKPMIIHSCGGPVTIGARP